MEFKETWQEVSTSSSKFVFFGPIGKTWWLPRPLIGWDISTSWLRHFRLLLWFAEQNSIKLDRKQDLNNLYQVCVFPADRKNMMAVPASDWLRHFWLLLWNRWAEFNQTWQETRSQCSLPILCFSGRAEKQGGRPGLWLAETFSTSPLKLLNRIQRNLAGSKISTSSTKFVFFWPIRKQDGRPGAWLAETFFTSSLKPMNGIQKTWQEARPQRLLQSLCFYTPRNKVRGGIQESPCPSACLPIFRSVCRCAVR